MKRFAQALRKARLWEATPDQSREQVLARELAKASRDAYQRGLVDGAHQMMAAVEVAYGEATGTTPYKDRPYWAAVVRDAARVALARIEGSE